MNFEALGLRAQGIESSSPLVQAVVEVMWTAASCPKLLKGAV